MKILCIIYFIVAIIHCYLLTKEIKKDLKEIKKE